MEDLIDEIGKELLPSQAAHVYKTLGKVLGNIVKNPDEPKFRSLKKDNKIVSETLGKSKCAINLLLQVGFKDVGSMYQCPPSADLTDLMMAAELIECLAESMGTDSVEVPKSAAPAPAPVAAQSGGYAKSAAPKAQQPLKGFTRNTTGEEERKRAEQADQLAAIRADKASRPAPPVAEDTRPAPAQEPQDVGQSAKPIKSAFDFESKSKKQEAAKKTEQSLEDIRALQKQKYSQEKGDSDKWKAAEYQKPSSSSGNDKPEEKSWWDPSGWFGGGSSDDKKKPGPGGGGTGPPRMKTINDLPKPVRRGG